MKLLVQRNVSLVTTVLICIFTGCVSTGAVSNDPVVEINEAKDSDEILYVDGDLSDLPEPAQSCQAQSLLRNKDNLSSVTFAESTRISDAMHYEDQQMSYAPVSFKGFMCRNACWALAGAGCTAICGACAWGTVYTIGGVAIPCKMAVVVACGLIGGAANACTEKLCPQ